MTTQQVGTQHALREELIRRRLAGSAAGQRPAGTGNGAAPAGGGPRDDEPLGDGPPGDRPEIGRADRSAPLVLAAGQRQLWFLNRLDPGSAEYLVPVALRLRGPLERWALRRAWTELVRRHELLRTRYRMADGVPGQVIDPPGEPAWTDLDLRELPAEDREAAASAAADRAATTGFDLAAEHPLRLTLVTVADADHLLVAVLHHIASDQVSQQVLIDELGAIYGALVAGLPSPLAEPTVQYADYAGWQHERRGGPEQARRLAYWRTELAGLPRLEIPTDHPRPPVRGWRGAVVPVTVPAPVAGVLRELGREHNATVFMTMLTVWQCLLARYTGQDDIPVGTVVSGREHPELARLLGYVMNNLVLRLRITGRPSFTDLLAANRERVLDAFDNQDVPFARLVDELQPERDMSMTPLFQVGFTTHEPPPGPFGMGRVRTEHVELSWQVAKTDLTLRLAELPDGGIGGYLEYASDLFTEATAARMAGHLARLAESIAADPGACVHDLELLPDGERDFLLAGPSQDVHIGSDSCPHELFAEQARRAPDAPAVSCGDHRLTYRQLDEAANRLAHHLRAAGAAVETLVGVCLDRDSHLVPALLGVLKSGAGYLPLDPAYPADRLRFMVDDAAARVVVTTTAHLELVRRVHSGAVVVLDDPGEAATIAARPAGDPRSGVGPGNLAYVIYTSGSTGTPKGVGVTHRNITRLFETCRRRLEFGEGDVWTLFHSYAFDASVWELWGALAHGGRLVVVPYAVSRSPEEHLALLAGEGVTMLCTTPTAFRPLVAAAEADAPALAGLRLRSVVLCGEKVEVRELAPWVTRFGLQRPLLSNMYGITETCVHTTFHQIGEDDLRPGAGNRIGVPLEDLRVHLLDRHGNLVPIGVPGEIYVGGGGVTRGYLRRPDLTAQRFVPDPFGAPGQRLYRSGDLARRLPTGALEFLGRIDQQVKLHGYRIELGEIAATLMTHPAVSDAVVVLREDTPGDKRLVAYLVPVDGGPVNGGPVDPGELRALAAASLPVHMIPAGYVTIERIPLTTNGKLDQRALPAPGDAAVRAAGAVVAPRTATEARIAAIWREVLGLDTIGVHDGFFALGGDSIRAVALVGALRPAGFEVSVRDVFEQRSVAALAEFLDARRAPAPVDRTVAPLELLDPADRALIEGSGLDLADAYPMSQVQIGMLVEMLAGGATNVYHNISIFKVRDDAPFVADALVAATGSAVARHEILRTGLDPSSYSVPMQLVHRRATMTTGSHDLRGLTAAEVDRRLRAFTARQRAELFDLAVPPLIRVFAHVVDDGWWLSITECHAVLEGWSFHSLLMELITTYRQVRDGDPQPRPAMPAVRYADFVAAELASMASDADRAHWHDIVTTRPKVELPAAWRDARVRAPYRIDLPCGDLMPALRDVAGAVDTSLKSVLHAAYLAVLGMLTDQDSFISGLVCDTRPEVAGADQVYGMYLNTVPFPFDRTARTWRELIRQTFEEHVRLWPHRRYPLPSIQRDSGSTQRLIDTFFIYLDFHVVDAGLVEPDTVIDDSPNEFGLTLGALGDGIVLHGRTDVLSRADAERLLAMYRGVLEAMIADLDGEARTPVLPADERDRLLVGWNRTAAPQDETGVLRRIRAVAERTPDAVAVADSAGAGAAVTLTYRQLMGRASAVSQRLGGAPDERPGDAPVAVLAGPGHRYLAAILGVLGAGGAFLPLEVAAPVPRLARLLADSGAHTVLVDADQADRARAAAEGLTVRVLVLDDTEHPPSRWTAPRGAESDRAYVIYTSGSTGMPKGAIVRRRGMTNHLLAKIELLELSGLDTVVQNAPLTFDVSVWQLLAPLLAGGRVRIVGRAAAADPAELFGTVQSDGVTVLEVVPSLLRAALDGWDAGADVPELARLRRLVVTGEALPPALCARWFARYPGIAVVNAYGPTECSDDVTHAVLTARDRHDGGCVPIGAAIRNTRLYVLDARGEPVPVGVPGELYVGGIGVGEGYLGDPGRTAAAFVADRFSGDPADRLYRTGDRVRYRPDGQLEFLGRRDHQVKVRGQRVEPGEVEAAIRAVPGVTDTVVTVDAGRLIGYLVGTAAPAAVRRRLVVDLPEHLVPSALMVLDALPLTANGKIDRGALPAPDRAALAGAPAVPPADAAQARLARVWCEVLGLDEVGVHDDFFAVGGDSIRTLTLVAALRRAGSPVSVRDVFECRTVAALARRLDAAQPAPRRALARLAGDPARPAAGESTLYCVHPQGGSAHWFLPLADRLAPDRSVAAFEAPDELGTGPVDLSELAAGYLAELPGDGDAVVLGWSSGATLAWELAGQLAAAGRPARALILIDPIGDPAVSPDAVSGDALIDRLAELLERDEQGPPGELPDPELPTLLRLAGLSADPADTEAMRRQVARTRALTEAMYTYRYLPAVTPIRLVVTDQCAQERHGVLRGLSYQDYLRHWQELAGAGIAVHRIAGEHDEAVGPTRAGALAELVAPWLTAAVTR